MNLNAKWALVTGASSGLGVHFARQLADRGFNLVITARREGRLERIASEIRSTRGVEVEIISADLSAKETPLTLFEQTENAGIPIHVLINNAGFGTLAPFADISWETTEGQIDLNIKALTHLTKLFVRPMVARKEGYILNVASMAAYLPIPLLSTYSASKAYVRNFTESLSHELRSSGVRVSCLCPGGTRTEFTDVAGFKLPSWQAKTLQDPGDCVQKGLKGLFAGQSNIIHGNMNSVGGMMLRFIPRTFMAKLANSVMQAGRG